MGNTNIVESLRALEHQRPLLRVECTPNYWAVIDGGETIFTAMSLMPIEAYLAGMAKAAGA